MPNCVTRRRKALQLLSMPPLKYPCLPGCLAVLAPRTCATTPGYESFYQDVNDHNFVFTPNMRPYNEQETLEFSVKADYQMDMGTLTAWALYSDQEQYLIADGTSGAFGFYGADAACIGSLQSNVASARRQQGPAVSAAGTPAGTGLQLVQANLAWTTCCRPTAPQPVTATSTRSATRKIFPSRCS